MTFGSNTLKKTAKTSLNTKHFIVKGQGVFQFTATYIEPCMINIYNDDKTDG
jgi:hypothetical protein